MRIKLTATVVIEYEADGAYPADIAQHYANTDARLLIDGALAVEDWPPSNVKVTDAKAETFDKSDKTKLYTGPARDPDANLKIEVEE